MSHSEDIKLRVVEAVRSGSLTISQASTIFKVTRRSIYKWIERVEQGDSLERRKPGRKPTPERIAQTLEDCREQLDDVFIRYLKKTHPEITEAELEEMRSDRSAFLLWFHGEVEELANQELRQRFARNDSTTPPDTPQ